MPDKIALIVDSQKVENFLGYRCEADIFTADDAFSFEFSNPNTRIKRGQRCELRINDELVLTGIIDKVVRSVRKEGVSLRAEGRDLMGLVVDSYCEEFITVKGKSLSELAELLLRKIPFINREAIIYEEDVIGTLAGKSGHNARKGVGKSLAGLGQKPHKFAQIEPGWTVFEVLRKYALSRGLLFYALPDGTFVFGRPKAKGEPLFAINVTKKDVQRPTNAIESEFCDDLSRRYSKVTVVGQRQGRNEDAGPAQINTGAVVEDPEVPFYKPFVALDNNDEFSPEMYARLLVEKQKAEGFHLSYRLPGHTQNGKVWTINELCQVKDIVAGLDGVYLIYARAFELGRQGKFTSLKLGLPGLVR